jgi:RNA polymerase sigma-70 factor (sigma-E family)
MTASEPGGVSARPLRGADILAAGTVLGPVPAEMRVGMADADAAVTELYGAHYCSLVRLAVLLVHDTATAEEVVQDSFAAMHARMYRLRDNGTALAYLRAAVVNRSHSALGHGAAAHRDAPAPTQDVPGAEDGALALLERSAVVAALRKLPGRQREVIVLRYYDDLSEAQIAATLGITPAAVQRHASRAMAALRPVLESES